MQRFKVMRDTFWLTMPLVIRELLCRVIVFSKFPLE